MTSSDNVQPPWWVILLLLAGVITVFVGFLSVGYDVGKMSGRNQMMEEAVKIYKAEYYLDEKHERQWRWKP